MLADILYHYGEERAARADSAGECGRAPGSAPIDNDRPPLFAIVERCFAAPEAGA